MEQEEFNRQFQQYAQSWIQRNGKRGMCAPPDCITHYKSDVSDVSDVSEVRPRLYSLPKKELHWFTQEQLHMMDNHPFEAGCPVRLKVMKVEDIFQSPMLRQANHLMDTLTKKELFLEPGDYIPASMVEALYEIGTRYTQRLDIENFTEAEVKEVRLLHTVLLETGLIQEDLGKMSLTFTGKRMLTDQNWLVRTIVTYLFKDFDISKLDSQRDTEFRYKGRLYSLWLLHNFGNNWHELKFYEKEYLNAYPSNKNKGAIKRNTRGFIKHSNMYSDRIFNFLFSNLGLSEPFLKFGDPGIKKSPLLERMFAFEEPSKNKPE